jgi:hypothetical protein
MVVNMRRVVANIWIRKDAMKERCRIPPYSFDLLAMRNSKSLPLFLPVRHDRFDYRLRGKLHDDTLSESIQPA